MVLADVSAVLADVSAELAMVVERLVVEGVAVEEVVE